MINLLLKDTRFAEILSALSLIVFSSFLFADVTSISKLIHIQSILFWAVIFFALGLMQFISVELHPRAEILRVTMSWLSGSLWIWLSIHSSLNEFSAADICAFFVGLGNLYAFCMNTILIKKQWAI